MESHLSNNKCYRDEGGGITMRRRGRLFKRGKRSWTVVLYLGRDPETRKEKRKWYTFGAQREAEQFLHQYLAHGNGIAPPATRLRLGEYLEQWLATYTLRSKTSSRRRRPPIRTPCANTCSRPWASSRSGG